MMRISKKVKKYQRGGPSTNMVQDLFGEAGKWIIPGFDYDSETNTPSIDPRNAAIDIGLDLAIPFVGSKLKKLKKLYDVSKNISMPNYSGVVPHAQLGKAIRLAMDKLKRVNINIDKGEVMPDIVFNRDINPSNLPIKDIIPEYPNSGHRPYSPGLSGLMDYIRSRNNNPVDMIDGHPFLQLSPEKRIALGNNVNKVVNQNQYGGNIEHAQLGKIVRKAVDFGKDLIGRGPISKAREMWGADFKPEWIPLGNGDYSFGNHGGTLAGRNLILLKNNKTGAMQPFYQRTGGGNRPSDGAANIATTGSWVPYYGHDKTGWFMKPQGSSRLGDEQWHRDAGDYLGKLIGTGQQGSNVYKNDYFNHQMHEVFGEQGQDAAVNRMYRAYGYDPQGFAKTIGVEAAYQQGGMTALQPIQTEKGETAQLPDNTFVKVAADQRHSQMDPGQITDAFPDQTYIFSDDPALRISKNIAKMIPIGQKLPTFREGKEAPEPETISLADRYFKNKKHMTPADLSKAVNSYFKLVDRPDDPIAAKTNMYQKQGRAQDLAMIQQLNEMLKGPEPGQGQQEPVMEEQMPMQAQEGGEIDYLKKIQEEYLKQFKEGQEPITQAPGEYGYLPQLTLAAQTALGLQGIASQQSQDPHFNVNPSRVDQMHPEYDPSIQLNALDANTVASLGPMMAKVKERGLSPLNTANYVAKAIADINTQKSNIADSSYKYNLKNMADKARFLTKNDEFNYGVDVRNISSANKKNQNFYNLAMSGMERGLGNAQNRRRYITEAEENRKNINNQLLQALLQADIFSKIK